MTSLSILSVYKYCKICYNVIVRETPHNMEVRNMCFEVTVGSWSFIIGVIGLAVANINWRGVIPVLVKELF